MAIYKHLSDVQKSTEADTFDTFYAPGTHAPMSGIYRCAGCGREDISTAGHPLPPQNHHQHSQGQGAIRWRLAVWADHRPK